MPRKFGFKFRANYIILPSKSSQSGKAPDLVTLELLGAMFANFWFFALIYFVIVFVFFSIF